MMQVKVLLPEFVQGVPSELKEYRLSSSLVEFSFHFISRYQIFLIVNKLPIAVHTLLINILILFSVNEILLPWYVKWSTNFKGLFLNVEMVPS